MASINFSSLLAINQKYRPAEVTQIVPRDAFQPPTQSSKQRKTTNNSSTTGTITSTNSNTTDTNGTNINSNINRTIHNSNDKLNTQPVTEDSEHDYDEEDNDDNNNQLQQQSVHQNTYWKDAEQSHQQSQQASDVAHELSLQTPICATTHGNNYNNNNTNPSSVLHPQHSQILQGERIRLHEIRKENEAQLSSSFHQVELSDWEHQIDWEGCTNYQSTATNTNSSSQATPSTSDKNTLNEIQKEDSKGKDTATSDETQYTAATNNINATSSSTRNKPFIPKDPIDAQSLLATPLNPFIDSMDFTKYISWEGADAPPGYNASLVHPTKSPLGQLVLQQGVAGTSIAKMTGLTSSTSTLPLPFSQSEGYQNRILGKTNSTGRAAGSGSGSFSMGGSGSLQKDVEEQKRQIEHNQKKRAEMAIEKTNRVKEALGTLALGGGTGRTITSSLMGPGGTERTGRPSRHSSNSSLAHDSEYVEQLELIYNHTLVKPFELSRAELRHFHRPKLPRRFFFPREIMPFQFQMRVFPLAGGGKGRRDSGHGRGGIGGQHGVGANWNQSNSMMNIPGAISQTKLKNEADLTPAEGEIILLEYSEERPPVQLSKGMACRIVNYYRGDKSKCPISVGGGDRPTRKKKHGDKNQAGEDGNVRGGSTGKLERPPRLVMGSTMESDSVTDLIGKIGEKKKDDGDNLTKKESSVKLLPEGVTEILHSKAHGPFIGYVKDGVTQTGLISNLFAAPMFRHETKQSDFLMILGKKPNPKQQGGPLKLNVVLRPLPDSVYCVGQTEPRVKVFAPGSNGEKSFLTPYSIYQIAKLLQRTRIKENRGLKFDEIIDGLFSNTEKKTNVLRQRIKQVAMYDKNTHIWTLKDVGAGTTDHTFPGVEALGREFTPEGVAAYESARAALQRLYDIGIMKLPFLTNNVNNLTTAITYLHGIISEARERKSEMSKMARTQSKSNNALAYALAEKKLDAIYGDLKRKGEVARFILEELQLAPWHLTSEFIDVHKNAQGTGMMKLTGLGDPSGQGAAYNFLRESDSKPNKKSSSGGGDGALNARIKKITGTENDLRKLTMKQMEKILLSYGMSLKDIKNLKRWDRVHCIRDLSTKAASDNMGDGLERYAREEKMKLSEQKKMYKERVQEIWERQRQTLSTDAGKTDNPTRTGGRSGAESGVDNEAANASEKAAEGLHEKEESDDDFDEDDFFKEFEDDETTNQLMRSHIGNEGLRVGALNDAAEDSKKDARELAALRRQNEEERAVRDGLGSESNIMGSRSVNRNRKVIRRKIVRTNANGSTEITFKFIVLPDEVQKIISKLKNKEEEISIFNREKKNSKEDKTDNGPDPNLIGHALFEDDDDSMDYKIQLQVKKKRGGRKRNTGDDSPPRSYRKSLTKSQSKLNKKQQTEKKIKKRKRDAEEKDLYSSNAKRKGTSNRRERGSLRDRMPHVIMADRLEQIRITCEKRPGSIPFHRPVDKRTYSKYYEVISNPIDLQTIRDKIQRYDYKTADSFVKDFEIMKNNAIKFNGMGHTLGIEATSIYDFVRTTIIENRHDFDAMELAVEDQLNSGKRKKGSRSSTPKNDQDDDPTSNTESTGKLANVTLDGITTTIQLGNLKSAYDGASDSDSSG